MSTVVTNITKNYFEHKAWSHNRYVCGLDEVGRGCLAGPVVASAAILPFNAHHPLLKDSKVLSTHQRNEAFAWINKHCWWTVALASHRIVDNINIYQTTLQCMKKAYRQLVEQAPLQLEHVQYVVTDAMPLNIIGAYSHEKLEYYHFTKGEQFSTSIAAASIVAKVTRDRIMENMSAYFPAFCFAEHKGYATKAHIDTLKALGPSSVHRLSFLSNVTQENNEKQGTLF